MSQSELAQLQMLAQVDELTSRLAAWVEDDSAWDPFRDSRALVRRVLSRAENLRIRLEAPLVVATFGGTGTGKSSLVNALVGRECTRSGRERPTTKLPVLLAHPQTDLEAAGLPTEGFEVVRADAPLLRDVILIDCPDPDTTETEVPGSNLQRLHRLLPLCDVLIYTSTQQKYRSARVGDELGLAATGCRLLFVQTHAELDDDIRDDWRRQLSDQYEVPEMFFVDSLRALEEQQADRRPSGDFARLQDLLTSGLAVSERVQIRRANLLDLIESALDHCRDELVRHQPAVEQLQTALAEQRDKLTTTMAERLGEELLVHRNLWERRLLESVTTLWGISPFSAMLRFYNGIGSLIASFSLFRARNSAQMALIGALQGARWLQSRKREREAESELERITAFGLDDATLREAQLVIAGYAKSARMDPRLLDDGSLERLRGEAARVEDEFLGDARRRIDEIIDDLAARNSRWYTRAWYELLFGAYLVFVLFRIGRNFFWDTFLREIVLPGPQPPVEWLSVDFYISAGVFFVLWSGLLVMMFTRRLRRGLQQRVANLAQELVVGRMSRGLFPPLEHACRDVDRQIRELDDMLARTRQLQRQIAKSPHWGAPQSKTATLAVSPT